MLDFFLETKLHFGFMFEVLAAIAGLLYIKKSSYVAPEIKLFVFYLLYIVLVEFYAFIPIYAWVHDYEVLSFYEDSVFRRNFIQVDTAIMRYGNVFLYSLYSLGFYVDYRNKRKAVMAGV